MYFTWVSWFQRLIIENIFCCKVGQTLVTSTCGSQLMNFVSFLFFLRLLRFHLDCSTSIWNQLLELCQILPFLHNSHLSTNNLKRKVEEVEVRSQLIQMSNENHLIGIQLRFKKHNENYSVLELTVAITRGIPLILSAMLTHRKH